MSNLKNGYNTTGDFGSTPDLLDTSSSQVESPTLSQDDTSSEDELYVTLSSTPLDTSVYFTPLKGDITYMEDTPRYSNNQSIQFVGDESGTSQIGKDSIEGSSKDRETVEMPKSVAIGGVSIHQSDRRNLNYEEISLLKHTQATVPSSNNKSKSQFDPIRKKLLTKMCMTPYSKRVDGSSKCTDEEKDAIAIIKKYTLQRKLLLQPSCSSDIVKRKGNVQKTSGEIKPKIYRRRKYTLRAPEIYRIENNKSSVYEENIDLYKVLMIGDIGTGKTSIIRQYVHHYFIQNYCKSTIGVEFILKVVPWNKNTTLHLQFWDLAGEERAGKMTRAYFKGAHGACIVFDITRRPTFDAATYWKKQLDSTVILPDGTPIPCVLLANKCDQENHCIPDNPIEMEKYCKENGFTAWFQTSAKENLNVEQAFNRLIKGMIHVKEKNDTLGDPDTLSLNQRNQNKDKERKCNC